MTGNTFNGWGKPANSSVKLQKGFAMMTPERRSEIAGMGGKAAHVKGTAHQFTSETARIAGLKSHENRGAKEAGKATKKRLMGR